MIDAIDNLVQVGRELQRLGLGDAVFVGGATVGLHVTDPGAGAPRVTLDVDVVVEATTRGAFNGIEERLRGAGHAPDPNGPIGRWLIQGVPVDLIPASTAVFGFTNRWYGHVLDTASLVEVAPGFSVRVATAAMFIATKLEAFLDRGTKDPMMSQDLTDIVSIVNGRPQLAVEVRRMPPDARAFVRRTVSDLLSDPDFAYLVHAHLPPDDASQDRAASVLDQFERLTSP